MWSYEESLKRESLLGSVQAMLWHRKELTGEQFETANWYELEIAACREALKLKGGYQAISWWEIDLWPVKKIEKLSAEAVKQFQGLARALDKGQKQALSMIECQVFDHRKLSTLQTALDVVGEYRARGTVDGIG